MTVMRDLKWMAGNPSTVGDVSARIAAAGVARIEALEAENAALRAQAQDWVTPLMRWEALGNGANLWLGPFHVGRARIVATSKEDWEARRIGADHHSRHTTEAEARQAVERAVKEALGVKPAIEDGSKVAQPEPARTCETCRWDAPTFVPQCGACMDDAHDEYPAWTPKTTASEELSK